MAFATLDLRRRKRLNERPLGRVAQLVEQGIENPRVGGSIPSPATIFFHIKATPGILSSENVTQCIEALCQCGCEAVRATIAAMEANLTVPQVTNLSHDERLLVLQELKAIMAVYDARK